MVIVKRMQCFSEKTDGGEVISKEGVREGCVRHSLQDGGEDWESEIGRDAGNEKLYCC